MDWSASCLVWREWVFERDGARGMMSQVGVWRQRGSCRAREVADEEEGGDLGVVVAAVVVVVVVEGWARVVLVGKKAREKAR